MVFFPLYRSYLRLKYNIYAALQAPVALLNSFCHSHSHGHGGAHHGVIAHAQKAHHCSFLLPGFLGSLIFFVQPILYCYTACGQSVDKNLSSIQFDIFI